MIEITDIDSKTKKPYVGLNVSEGLNRALKRAHKNLQMSRSEFVRYCVMKTLQEMSLLEAEARGDKKNEP